MPIYYKNQLYQQFSEEVFHIEASIETYIKDSFQHINADELHQLMEMLKSIKRLKTVHALTVAK
ncbi:hypothetical protein MHB42_09515 [Lysinibacillus sp. FSL K6-0232]|uniref:hypothetical protein n=1 Tax=unclassified Lysinibacillus TaxID=2636778 RepID=UPI0030F8C406